MPASATTSCSSRHGYPVVQSPSGVRHLTLRVCVCEPCLLLHEVAALADASAAVPVLAFNLNPQARRRVILV